MKAVTIKWTISEGGRQIDKEFRIDQPAALAVANVQETRRIELPDGKVLNQSAT